MNRNNRELSVAEHGLVVTAFLIGALLIGACSGCSSSRQNMYMAQALDVATTTYALECDQGFSEGNSLLGDLKGVLIGKAVFIGLSEGLAWAFPNQAKIIYKIGAVYGYGAGAWNGYQIGTH